MTLDAINFMQKHKNQFSNKSNLSAVSKYCAEYKKTLFHEDEGSGLC